MPAPSPITKPSRVASQGRRGLLRLVVAGGQGAHGAEAGDGERRDHRLGAAGDHGVGLADAG